MQARRVNALFPKSWSAFYLYFSLERCLTLMMRLGSAMVTAEEYGKNQKEVYGKQATTLLSDVVSAGNKARDHLGEGT